ncbi:MAG: DbpA RNA binding domain-containing protein [Longimicrobiales bacterium]
MAGFEELGIRGELVDTVEQLGYRAPTRVQREAVPMLRRGGNVVILASAGSGALAAYGLGVLDRIGDAGNEAAESSPNVLILGPTVEEVERRGLSIARLGQRLGVRVAATGMAASAQPAAVLVTTPREAAAAIRASRLKLDALDALVADGLDAMMVLGAGEAIELIFGSAPAEAQRIVVTGEFAGLDGFVERHVRRAVHVPPRTMNAQATEGAARRGARAPLRLGYAVATQPELIRMLTHALSGSFRGAAVICRTAEEAAATAAQLRLRGIEAVTAEGSGAVHVHAAAEAGTGDQPAVSLHAPFDEEDLLRRHGAGGLILVEPRELPHLRRTARRADAELGPLPDLEPRRTRESLEAFRSEIRDALASDDLDAHLLLLEPLLAEHPAIEVAAAAAALLRRRAIPTPSREVAAGGAPAPAPWTRLFISVGERDRIAPGDLLGAMTGEAGISGDQVGKIEIRDTFAIVEVQESVAQRVIAALNGTTLRNRSVRVDYDRRTGGAVSRRRPPSRPRQPRG